MDPLVAARMMGRRRTESLLDRLTPRELEVLSLMAQGQSNHAIATRLFLTAKTVETHVRMIFQKLDLVQTADDHRRVQAVLQFLERSP